MDVLKGVTDSLVHIVGGKQGLAHECDQEEVNTVHATAAGSAWCVGTSAEFMHFEPVPAEVPPGIRNLETEQRIEAEREAELERLEVEREAQAALAAADAEREAEIECHRMEKERRDAMPIITVQVLKHVLDEDGQHMPVEEKPLISLQQMNRVRREVGLDQLQPEESPPAENGVEIEITIYAWENVYASVLRELELGWRQYNVTVTLNDETICNSHSLVDEYGEVYSETSATWESVGIDGDGVYVIVTIQLTVRGRWKKVVDDICALNPEADPDSIMNSAWYTFLSFFS